MAVVSMNSLLEAGVHFGHQTKRWNPKMKPYIYTSRDEIYIIDLKKTKDMIEEAYDALKKIAENGGKVLFVGTRKQAQDAIREEAIRSESYYVTERWLGGTLTNYRTIRRRVKRLEEIENMEKDGTFDLLPKKEVIGLKKEYAKLDKLLCGIREMNKLPDAMFIVDPSKEDIAIREARKLNIPVFGIVDTNCDPDMVDYIIPANDDAIRAVKLITGVMANAICEANGLKMNVYETDDDKNTEVAEEIMQKAVDSVHKKEDRRGGFNRNKRFNKKPFNRDFKAKKETVKEETTKKEDVKKEEPKVEEPKKEKVTKKVVKEEKAPKTESADLSKLTVSELREMAKEKKIKGYSTMKKAELIDALK